MELTKNFVESTFRETLQQYKQRVCSLQNIVLNYVSPEKYLADAKVNPVNQHLIKLGAFTNFEKEYPGFLVVYEMDKHPLNLLITGNFKVSMCFERAKELLRPFKSHVVREYLKHCFAHEITHIVEDRLKVDNPTMWQSALSKVHSDEALAHETLAEDVADLIGNLDLYNEVNYKLWSVVQNNLTNRRMTYEQGKNQSL
jgi:hypothetical protein